MNYLQFLSVLDQWLNGEERIDAAAIVGSYARQTAHEESDVDIAILTDYWLDFTEQRTWLEQQFPTARDVRMETWGPVKAIRFWLDELEVELNFSPLFWANVPVDPGTANVVAGGMTIMKDQAGLLQTLITAVADGEVVNIRTHLSHDAEPLARLFYDAVHAIPDTLYSTEQKQAWAPEFDDSTVEKWQQRIEKSRPFVAEYDDQVVGFIELEPTGQIECFYVSPNYQDQGIGGQLFQQLLNEARGFGLTALFVDASHAAKPFFTKRGFQVEQENTVSANGVALTNWRMRLAL